MRPEDCFSKMFNWLARARGVSSFDKLLYTRVYGHLGKNDSAFPGVRRLAEELNAHASQVSRGLKRLEDMKLLRVVRQTGRNGEKYSNRYYFPDHPLMHEVPVSPSTCEEGVHPVGTPVNSVGTGGVHSVGTRVHSVGTEETHSRDSGEEIQRETQFAGSLRSPDNVSLRSPLPSPAVVTESQFPNFKTSSPKWTDAADVAVLDLPQPPAPGVCSGAAEWNQGVDMRQLDALVARLTLQEGPMSVEDDRQARLASAKLRAEGGADKYVKEQAAIENKRRAKQAREPQDEPGVPKKVKVSKPKPITILMDMERLWFAEFKRKFPEALIASHWEAKEGVQMQGLLKLYAQEDVERAVRYYIRYWEVHRPRLFKGTAKLPNLGQLRAVHAQIVPEAKQMFQALQVQAEYKKWSADNRMTALPPPKALQDAYDRVKADLKDLGF